MGRASSSTPPLPHRHLASLPKEQKKQANKKDKASQQEQRSTPSRKKRHHSRKEETPLRERRSTPQGKEMYPHWKVEASLQERRSTPPGSEKQPFLKREILPLKPTDGKGSAKDRPSEKAKICLSYLFTVRSGRFCCSIATG